MSGEQHSEPRAQHEQRRYTRDFKREAVRLSEDASQSVAQVARDLGVPERILYKWRQQLCEPEQLAFPGTGHASLGAVEAENRLATPPDPQEIADAVAHVIALPAGARPLRTVVAMAA